MPLTIAQFTDNYGPRASGILYAVQFLETNVLDAGHRLVVVAPACAGPNPLAGHQGRREIRLPSVFIPGMHVNLATGKDFDYRLAQLVANPPDVIHVHGLGPIGLLGLWVAERTGKPLIVTWHTDFEAYAEHYWHLAPFLTAAYRVHQARVLKTWEQVRKSLRPRRPRRGAAQVEVMQIAASMLAEADLVTTPSDKTGRRVLELAPSAKVRVVPNGTDPLPDAEPVAAANGPRLLYIGRIAQEKGIDLLLDAFELVRDEIPDAELMIVGDPDAGGAALGRRLHRATHAGVVLGGHLPREALGAHYASADVFVFPSLTDTQALVLHEAAHAGLPFVLVDDELRLVVDPGVNALLARANPISLAGGIIEMLHALEDPEFAARAHARSRELAARWTIAGQSREVIELYEALAAGRPIELTHDLHPDLGRRIFPQRKVTATFEKL